MYILCRRAQSLQFCLTLCDPMDCSLPGSSALGVSQARILEWVAMPSSRRSSPPRDRIRLLSLLHCRQLLYSLSHLGSCIQLYQYLFARMTVSNRRDHEYTLTMWGGFKEDMVRLLPPLSCALLSWFPKTLALTWNSACYFLTLGLT